MRRLVLLLGVAVAASLSPSAASAQTTHSADSAAVMGTLQRFVAALRIKDTAGMRAELDSAARMTLLRPGTNGVRVMVLDGTGFIAAATRGAALDEPIRNQVVQIHQDLATVWAEYQVRIDGKVSHCGYDAFHLVRKGGAWKILNVADTFRREGCGEKW